MADFRGPQAGPPTHIVGETGLAVFLDGNELTGRVQVVPELHVPGTQVLRASALAMWTDVLTGLLAMASVTDRVPVTLDLAVEVPAPVVGCPVLLARARTLKAGRSVVVLGLEFCEQGRPGTVAFGTAAFMPSPDASFQLPALADVVGPMGTALGPLQLPLAQRADCTRTGSGTARMQRRPDGLNATDTINGALLALVTEEAALSAAPDGAVVSSLALRYLRAARTGPVTACAVRHGQVSRVEVRDDGNDDRQVVVATVRTS